MSAETSNGKAPYRDKNQLPPKNARAGVIAISSGKGGVGKTNTAANLGIALEFRFDYLLIDTAAGISNSVLTFLQAAQYSGKKQS